MEIPLSLILSNRLEILLKVMIKSIQASRTSPFERVMVVVPTPAMKHWMTHILAKEEGIAFGIDILFFNDLFRKISPKMAKEVPGVLELALAIEKKLSEMEGHPFPFFYSSEYAEKKARVSLEIASEFLKWGEYGEMELKKWKVHSPAHWQAMLWNALFQEEWKPLYASIDALEIQKPSFPLQIHFFGLSYISEVKQKLIFRMNQIFPVNMWILSPSRMFLSDLKSQKEQARLLVWLEKQNISSVQIQDLHVLLEEVNPLLGNNCRLGREWMRRMEEASLATEEVYGISQALYEPLEGVHPILNEKMNLLRCIQRDLVVMSPHLHPISLEENDRSLEIHQSSSILREVQALYQTLLRACDDNQVQPCEIVAMVPKLSEYAPFIDMVFNGKESQIPAKILEPKELGDSTFIQAFFQLLELALSRFELSLVEDLLENPHFKMKFSSDMREVFASLKAEGVCWGLSFSHRQEILKQEPLEKGESGCFSEGFDHLLQSLSLKLSTKDFFEEKSEIYFKKGLQFTQSEALGELIFFLKDLKEDLAIFSSKKERTWAEWSSLLSSWMEKYLNEDAEGKESLFQAFRHIKPPQGWKINGEGLLTYLKAAIEESSFSIHERNLQAVWFCCLQPMRAIPAKIVALLGLSSEDFPRQEKRSPYRVLECTYIPSSCDTDRYLFLESLLSAREKWILSFIATDSKGPSCLVQEVIQYIDERYLLGERLPSKKIYFEHPQLPFDPSYFSQENPYPTGSEKDFAVAKSSLNIPEKHLNPFFIQKPLEISSLSLDRLPSHLTLTDLSLVFRHPIQYFMKTVLGIKLKEKEDVHPLMVEFEESKFWESDWLRFALRYPIQRIVQWAEINGHLPQEPFKKAAALRLEEKLQELLQTLKKMEIFPQEVYEVEFSHENSSWKQVEEHRWTAPCISIPYRGKTIALTGRLPYVCPKGVLSFKDKKLQTFVSMIPESMFLQEVLPKISSKAACFLKIGKTIPLQNPSWEKFFDHILRAFHQPLPLAASWIEPILAEDSDLLQKLIQPSFQLREDPYLKWAIPNIDLKDCAALIFSWKKEAEELFGGLQ